MKYIVTVEATYQVTEDRWRRVTKTRTADETTTLKEIEDWVNSKHGDPNTVQLHLNEVK